MVLRILEENEIDEILNEIPNIPSPFKNSSEITRNQLIAFYKEQLLKIKINDKGIEDLKKEIKELCLKSLIPSNEPIGHICSMAMSQPVTQSILSGFHQTGRSKDVKENTAVALTDLQLVRPPKIVKNIIHFKNYDLTSEEAYDLCFKLEGLNLENLLKERPSVLTKVPLEDEDWVKKYMICNNIPFNFLLFENEEMNVKEYEDDKEILNKNVFLRLKLDIYKCIKHGITSYDIIDKLVNKKNNIILGLSSAFYKGIIYLVAGNSVNLTSFVKGNKSLNNYINEIDYKKIFFNSIFIPNIRDKIFICGVKDLVNVKPQNLSLMSKIENIIKLDKYIFRIDINNQTLLYEIPEKKFIKFFESLGFYIVENNLKNIIPYLIIESKDDLENVDELKKSITKKINDNKEEYLNKLKSITDTNGPYYVNSENYNIYRNSEYIYCVGYGKNIFYDLKNIKFIDINRYYCTCINTMKKIVGITGANVLLVREYIRLIKDAGDTPNPDFVKPLAFCQNFLGKTIPMTSHGAKTMSVNALSNAAIQDPLNHISHSAAFGIPEDINDVVSSIIVGKNIKVGTGNIDILIDDKILGEKLNLESIEEETMNEVNEFEKMFDIDKIIEYNNEDYTGATMEEEDFEIDTSLVDKDYVNEEKIVKEDIRIEDLYLPEKVESIKEKEEKIEFSKSSIRLSKSIKSKNSSIKSLKNGGNLLNKKELYINYFNIIKRKLIFDNFELNKCLCNFFLNNYYLNKDIFMYNDVSVKIFEEEVKRIDTNYHDIVMNVISNIREKLEGNLKKLKSSSKYDKGEYKLTVEDEEYISFKLDKKEYKSIEENIILYNMIPENIYFFNILEDKSKRFIYDVNCFSSFLIEKKEYFSFFDEVNDSCLGNFLKLEDKEIYENCQNKKLLIIPPFSNFIIRETINKIKKMISLYSLDIILIVPNNITEDINYVIDIKKEKLNFLDYTRKEYIDIDCIIYNIKS